MTSNIFFIQTLVSTVLKLEDPTVGRLGGTGVEYRLDDEWNMRPNVCVKLLYWDEFRSPFAF